MWWAEDPGQNAGQNADESDVMNWCMNPYWGQCCRWTDDSGALNSPGNVPRDFGEKSEIVTVDNKSEKQEAANAVED